MLLGIDASALKALLESLLNVSRASCNGRGVRQDKKDKWRKIRIDREQLKNFFFNN